MPLYKRKWELFLSTTVGSSQSCFGNRLMCIWTVLKILLWLKHSALRMSWCSMADCFIGVYQLFWLLYWKLPIIGKRWQIWQPTTNLPNFYLPIACSNYSASAKCNLACQKNFPSIWYLLSTKQEWLVWKIRNKFLINSSMHCVYI